MTPLLCYMALNNSTVDHVQEFSSATVVNPCTSSSLLLANIKKNGLGKRVRLRVSVSCESVSEPD